MTLAELRASDTVILDTVSGSHAYGLATEHSDVDRKGVFCLPQHRLLGFGGPQQISDARNDEVYYELGRFVELATRNNPNILELLATPPSQLLHRHPALDLLPADLFLSKRCEQTFGRYAMAQIKKARGLNKKVVNPMPRERKGVLDFCYALVGAGSQPLREWLAERGLEQARCGLANVPNARGVYALYVDASAAADLGYGGIVSATKESNDVRLSSIPKGERLRAYVSYNADGYSQHCRAHREYWVWVAERNDARYEGTLAHGGGYDAKNLMHTFRLLDMALEILRDGELHVVRPNRDELLEIKRGAFAYEELMARAEEKMRAVEEAAFVSPLPEQPNERLIEERLVEVRKAVYGH